MANGIEMLLAFPSSQVLRNDDGGNSFRTFFTNYELPLKTGVSLSLNCFLRIPPVRWSDVMNPPAPLEYKISTAKQKHFSAICMNLFYDLSVVVGKFLQFHGTIHSR